MKICKTCDSFIPTNKFCVPKDSPFGGCNMMTYADSDPTKKDFVMYSDYEGYAAGVCVREDFGCNQWQLIKPKKNIYKKRNETSIP